MKKFLSFVLCLTLITSVLSFLTLGISAEDAKISLPDFDIPFMSFSTFAETGLPYAELLSCFPTLLETRYENGIFFAKDLGGDQTFLSARSGFSCEGTLVDGYWQFDIPLDAYNAGGSFSMYTASRSWHVQYDFDGNLMPLSLDKYTDNRFSSLQLYPKTYGEQYVCIIYELLTGIRVSDTYDDGFLQDQTISLHNNNESIFAHYDAQGNLNYINIHVNSTGENLYFLPKLGWSEYNNEYVPVNAPTGFENATLETFTSLLPTDINCEHKWEAPLCDAPSTCSLCGRTNGKSLGHNWVEGDEYSTCSTCNGILYSTKDLTFPSFEARPALTLAELNIDADNISSKLPKKVITKYENGTFMIPNFDGCFVSIASSDGFIKTIQRNGWNLAKIPEEKLSSLSISFNGSMKNGDNSIDYTFSYKADGTLIFYSLDDFESRKSISLVAKKNILELSYPKDENSTLKYIDIYENGNLTGQAVHDTENRLKVYYDSSLNVSKVIVHIYGTSPCLIPGKGWFADDKCTKSISAPEGYENKSAEYFANAYPHNINFCIHNWENSGNKNVCTKCGEIVVLKSYDALFIGLAIGIIVLVAAATAIVIIKRKKGAKLQQNKLS